MLYNLIKYTEIERTFDASEKNAVAQTGCAMWFFLSLTIRTIVKSVLMPVIRDADFAIRRK